MRAEGFRSDAIRAAFLQAIAGKTTPLFEVLCVQSGLPGPRANLALANTFADECVGQGKKADRLIDTMIALDAVTAPGASAREFLPLCGVVALGARAARDRDRKKALRILHDASEDLRFRVREAVPIALARIGATAGDELLREVGSWMDGFFQAAAVLIAIGDQAWLNAIDDVPGIVEILDAGWILARDAPRSAARWPGRKALVEVLGKTPRLAATRFGVPIFDLLVGWAKTQDPELRAAIEANLRDAKLAGRHANDLARVRAAIKASIPPPRDPTILVQGMRGRGKKRRR